MAKITRADGKRIYIKCPKCGLKQMKAMGWDYQKCKCGEYLYDER